MAARWISRPVCFFVSLAVALMFFLSACGPGPEQVESPGMGVDEHGYTIDALSFTAVSSGDGVATLVGTLLNHGDVPDSLVGVSATAKDGAIKSMLDHGPVRLPVGEPVRLAAQSAVTLTSPNFRLGYLMNLTLHFDRSADLRLKVVMRPQSGVFKEVEVTESPQGDGAAW